MVTARLCSLLEVNPYSIILCLWSAVAYIWVVLLPWNLNQSIPLWSSIDLTLEYQLLLYRFKYKRTFPCLFHVAIILVLMSCSCKLRDDRQGKVSWLLVAVAVPQLLLLSLFCVWWEFNGNAFINLLLLRPPFMLFRKKEQPLYSGKTLAAPGRGNLCPPKSTESPCTLTLILINIFRTRKCCIKSITRL